MTGKVTQGTRRMPRMLATCLLAATLALPAPSRADAFGDMFGFMFRMMLTMMNVMSDVVNDDSGGWGGFPGSNFPLGSGATTWPLMSGMYGLGGLPGMNPWTDAGGWPVSGFGLSPWDTSWPGFQNPGGYPGAFNHPYAGTSYGHPYSRNRWYGRHGRPPFPINTRGPQTALLDGRWYGNTGEILDIRANRFQLRNGLLALTGIIRLQNNLLTLYTPQTRSVQVYTFVRNQTNLILQDSQGKILTFRKRPDGFSNLVHTF